MQISRGKVDFTDRCLGKGGPCIGPIGIGTWAIGGPFTSGEGCHYPTGAPLGYGQVDDAESIRAIHCAVEMGAQLLDTADAYGTGHAECIIGEALRGHRSKVLIATKFGNTYDEKTRTLTGTDVSAAYIRQACEASLKRLRTDWIDLYQLHLGDLPTAQVEQVVDTLDDLRRDGMIRYHGWSTDDPERADHFGDMPHAAAIQFDMNVFQNATAMLDMCDQHDFAAIIRAPLAMGFLSGKFSTNSHLPENDIRAKPPAWLPYFRETGAADLRWQQKLDSVREILTSRGRTQAQGALAWIWACSERAIPIPGVRTVAQVEENMGAVEFGPLEPEQMSEIENLLCDESD